MSSPRIGAPRGGRQRGNSLPRAAQHAKPGDLISCGLRVELAEYMKAHKAAAEAGLSLHGYIRELIRRDQVDEETGRPLWVEPPAAEQLTANADNPAA